MTAINPDIDVRPMEQRDLDRAIEIEAEAHRFIDEDFGFYQLPIYAWEREDFLETIKRYRSKRKATNETQMFVAEKDVGKSLEVVGTLAFERGEDGFEILLLSAQDDEARTALLRSLVDRAKISVNRKKVSFIVPDGDYKTLKFLMNNPLTGKSDKNGAGFQVKYMPNPNPGGNDAWEAVCLFPTDKQKAAPAAK